MISAPGRLQAGIMNSIMIYSCALSDFTRITKLCLSQLMQFKRKQKLKFHNTLNYQHIKLPEKWPTVISTFQPFTLSISCRENKYTVALEENKENQVKNERLQLYFLFFFFNFLCIRMERFF